MDEESKALDDIHKEVKKERDNSFQVKILFGIIAFLVAGFITSVSLIAGYGVKEFRRMSADMYTTYIRDTKEILISRNEIEAADSWERLPINEQKERLRERYYTILRYYTVEIPENQKLNDEQIIESFNIFFDCIYAVKSVNFFLPVAYMKIMTNFNPNFENNYRYGIAWLLETQGENAANLLTVRESDSFRVAYKGKQTLDNQNEAIKLLIARMDNLMKKFNNREDWVIWAMLDGEDTIIQKYWENGNGTIPDELYHDSKLGEILDYYYMFKNWKVVPNE